MAHWQSSQVREVLTSFLPQRLLTRLGSEAGVGQRRRKVRVHALFWTLVLGFGAGRERTLAGLRRAYERATRITLAPSAFYDRFTPQLARFLRAVAVQLLDRVAEPTRRLKGPMPDQLADALEMRAFRGFPGVIFQPRNWSRIDGLRLQFGSVS